MDVVVVGAGLAGCSVAWHLAPHARVQVIDQAPQPGAEATAQNAGLVRRLGEDPHERALAMRSVELLEALEWPASRVVGAILGLAFDATHLHDGVAHLRARGVRIERCDRPGDVAPALKGSPLLGAWYLPEERIADAHTLTRGFVRDIQAHGGTLSCGLQVRALLRDRDRCVGVLTDRGRIDADRVVLAAGAWSAGLAATADLHRPLVPLRRTLLHSARHPLADPAHPWCWIDDAGLYARPESGGWLLCGCDEAVDPPPPGPGSRGPVAPERRAVALDKLERLMPALGDVRITGGWTGLRTFAPDRAPVLGEDPALPGLWWAAGLGGFGVTCCLAVGEAVATWMRGESLAWLRPGPVSPGRPFLRRWPIRPDGSLGATRLVDA